jgi:hypothetical protein
MKRFICLAAVLTFFVITIDAQRSRSSRERDRRESRYEEDNLTQNLWYGISLGNLFFFGDFSISLKAQGGYKPADRISVGLQSKMYYDFINNVGQDYSVFSYGGGPEVRLKITDSFYAIGEYNLMSLQNVRNLGSPQLSQRENINFPSAGIGYQQGRGPWKFGAQVLFIFSEEARDPQFLNRVVDYWLDFNYKF